METTPFPVIHASSLDVGTVPPQFVDTLQSPDAACHEYEAPLAPGEAKNKIPAAATPHPNAKMLCFNMIRFP
jgi:hypothetical protein